MGLWAREMTTAIICEKKIKLTELQDIADIGGIGENSSFRKENRVFRVLHPERQDGMEEYFDTSVKEWEERLF